MTDLAPLFLKPQNNARLRYETLRAAFVDKMPLCDVADRFGFTYGTVRNLCSEFRKNPDMAFFLPDKMRKQKPAHENGQKPAEQVRIRCQERILQLRRQQNQSVADICAVLHAEGPPASESTVGRTLRQAGFGKLRRRTLRERFDRVTVHRAATADCRSLDLSERRFTSDFGGLFLFAHDLARMDIDGLLSACGMLGSVMIPAGCAVRALQTLKL